MKAAGFEGVEPMSHMRQDEVVKAFEETGLKPASVCCNTHWNRPLSSPDDRVRQEGREGFATGAAERQALRRLFGAVRPRRRQQGYYLRRLLPSFRPRDQARRTGGRGTGRQNRH